MLDLLGLPGIDPVDLRSQNNTIIVVANVVEGDVPPCPSCGNPLYRHGRRTNTFADMPMQGQPVRLELSRLRYRCNACGVLVIPELAFLDERRRATRRLVDVIREHCLGMTFHALAKQTGLAVNTIKNIAHDLIGDLEQTVHYETPVIMGIDEVTLAGGVRCVITNLAMNTLVQILEGRTLEHLIAFCQKQPDTEAVEWVCTDMWRPALHGALSPCLPNARWVVEKAHVLAMASDALKAVRQVSPTLDHASTIKDAFCRIYEEPTKDAAVRAFEAWEQSILDGGEDGFRGLAEAVHCYDEEIFAYWDSPCPILHGYIEGLSGLTKVAGRMGRGYSYEIIRAKMLYDQDSRQVGSGVRMTEKTGDAQTVEYGPHIPTLIDSAEAGALK